MRVKKGKHSLEVTERAFKVIYKDLGYKLDKGKEKQEEKPEQTEQGQAEE